MEDRKKKNPENQEAKKVRAEENREKRSRSALRGERWVIDV